MLGSVANNIMETQIENSTSSQDFGIWLGFRICVLLLVCRFSFILIDKKKLISAYHKEKRPKR